MSKKTKSSLEKRFDVSKFAPLFSLHKKGDNEFPSVNFESEFSKYQWNIAIEDTTISFPLHNFLIDRYFGTKHSFINGVVMVNLKFPFMIEKEKGEIVLYKYCPQLWELHGIYLGNEPGERYFEGLKTRFSKSCMKKYPSLNDLSLGHKIRFASIVYGFCKKTNKQDVPRIKKMLNQLFDDDAFMKYFIDVVLPYIFHLQLSEFRKQVDSINIHKKDIKSIIEFL